MKHSISYLLLLTFYLASSCTERYQLPDTGKQTTIVITGLVTNEAGPYYVKVMENVSDLTTLKTTKRGIDHARITITDSNGHVDELRSFYSVEIDSVFTGSGYIYGTDILVEYYMYFLNIPDGNGGYITFSIHKDIYDHYKIRNDFREGVYFTTSTKGIPGQSYTLKVEYDGQEYTATDYMCHGTVIDSISTEPIGRYIYDKPDGTDGFMVPCLYFSEPQDEVNFYMFKIGDTEHYWKSEEQEFEIRLNPAKDLVLDGIGGEDWPISVVSDRFFPPYVSKYKLSDGDSPRKWYSGTDMGFHGSWEKDKGGIVDMYCITEPVYRYYYALSQQYYNDGGAFSASPASPPTNISGGAQGCFSAASVSQYSKLYHGL